MGQYWLPVNLSQMTWGPTAHQGEPWESAIDYAARTLLHAFGRADYAARLFAFYRSHGIGDPELAEDVDDLAREAYDLARWAAHVVFLCGLVERPPRGTP